MPSPDPPKLYLNEHLSPRLAAQLRRHGFDALSSHEAQMRAQPDADQLRFAASQKRALVTFNFADFSDLHERYLVEEEQHWGIIFSTAEPIGLLLHRLVRLLNSITAEEMRNQIRWLNEFK